MAGGSNLVKHLWVQGGVNGVADVNETTPEYPGQLGKVATVNPRSTGGEKPGVIQYVLRDSDDTTVAAAAFAVAYWSDVNDFKVCADQSVAAGGSTAPEAAGLFLGTLPAAGKYGFIQVAGDYFATLGGVNTVDLVIGTSLYGGVGDDDGKVDYPVVGTDAATLVTAIAIETRGKVGVAQAAQADSSASVAIRLTVDRNGW